MIPLYGHKSYAHMLKHQVNICLHHTSQDKYTVACTFNSVSSQDTFISARNQDWRKIWRWRSQTNDCDAERWLTWTLFFAYWMKLKWQMNQSTKKPRGTITRFNVERTYQMMIEMTKKKKNALCKQEKNNQNFCFKNILNWNEERNELWRCFIEILEETSSKSKLCLIAQMDDNLYCFESKDILWYDERKLGEFEMKWY